MGVSSLLGSGIDEFLKTVDLARAEYLKEYLPEIKKLKAKKDEAELAR